MILRVGVNKKASSTKALADPVITRAAIDSVEMNFPVHEWDVNGVSLWPTLKIFSLMNQNLEALYASQLLPPLPKTSPVRRSAKRFVQGTLLRAGSLRKPMIHPLAKLPTTELLVCALGASFVQTDAGWSIPLIEPLLNKARASGLNVFLLLSDGTSCPEGVLQTEFDYLNSQNRILAHDMQTCLFAMHAPPKRREIHTQRFLPEALQQLNAKLPDLKLTMGKVSWLAWRLLRIRASTQHFLAELGPRKILIQGSYGGFGQPLCAAAHDLKIPVYDVQHGVQGPHHEAYTFSAEVAATSTTLPHGYLCWSKPAVEHLKSWTADDVPVLLGVPFALLTEHAKNAAQVAPTQRIQTKKRVLYLAARGEGPKAFSELVESSPQDVDVVWCRHPLCTNAPPLEGIPSVSSSTLLKEIFVSDVAVTGLSSSVLEAHAVGLPILVHSAYGKQLLISELEGENVFFEPLSETAIKKLFAVRSQKVDMNDLKIRFDTMWDTFEKLN